MQGEDEEQMKSEASEHQIATVSSADITQTHTETWHSHTLTWSYAYTTTYMDYVLSSKNVFLSFSCTHSHTHRHLGPYEFHDVENVNRIAELDKENENHN